VIVPFQSRASAASFREGAGVDAEDAADDVAATIVTPGWRASTRSSSWPVYPVAPATATRVSPSLSCRPFARGWSLTGWLTLCIGKYIYTRYSEVDQLKSMYTFTLHA